MEYTIEVKGQYYDLPKFTKKTKEKIDSINKQMNNASICDDTKYKAIQMFLKESIGDDNTTEILGTDDIDDIDINELAVCFLKICNAYDKPVQDEEKKKVPEKDMELVSEIIKNSGNIQKLTQTLEKGRR